MFASFFNNTLNIITIITNISIRIISDSHQPSIVYSLTLLDPVSLLLSLPDVAFGFLYRSPNTIVQAVIYYFASRELTIAHTLHRNFWWYRNALWLEDIPDSIPVIVGIGGVDEVASPSALKEYVDLCTEKRRAKAAAMEKTRTVASSTEEMSPCDNAMNNDNLHSHSSSSTSSSSVATATKLRVLREISYIAPIESFYWPGYSHGQV